MVVHDDAGFDLGPADWGERDPAWAGVTDGFIEVLGRPIHLLRYQGDEAGTPQLLIHGLGGAARNWLDVMPALGRWGDVVAVDLPGFGQSPIPPDGSARMRANTGFVRALLDGLGWDRAVVFGNSMGGLIATLVAGRYPDRVSRLVLVNPALPGSRGAVFRQPSKVYTRILPAAVPGIGRLVVEAAFRQKTAEELVEESFASVLAEVERVRPTMRRALVENADFATRWRWRREAVADAAASLVAMHIDGRELFRSIDELSAPTLLLWGDRDLLVSTHVIAGLIARRPEWSRHDFEGVGHAPMLEVPEEFVDVVTAWYATLDTHAAA